MARPRSRSAAVVGLLAALALVVHFWGLYRNVGPPTLPWFPQADKLEHLVGFGLPTLLVLSALALRARDEGRRLRTRTVALVAAAFALHGVVSELVQTAFYTTRTGDPRDTLADWVGTAFGLGGFLMLARRSGWRPGVRASPGVQVRDGRA